MDWCESVLATRRRQGLVAAISDAAQRLCETSGQIGLPNLLDRCLSIVHTQFSQGELGFLSYREVVRPATSRLSVKNGTATFPGQHFATR